MATKSELFTKCITEAMDAAKGIATPVDKAKAYAEIARALAMTMGGGSKAAETTPAEIAEPVGKDAINPDKAKAETKKTAIKAPVKTAASAPKPEPTPDPESASEPEDDETWTDRMQEKYAAQMGRFEEFLESYGEENIIQCIEAFSEEQYHELTDITPLNIDAFISFLEGLEAQQK